MKYVCKEEGCGKTYVHRKRYMTHKRKHEHERRIERRRQMGHVCGSCKHHSSNSHFKLYEGKPIPENSCLVSGRRRTGMKPWKTDPDSGCIHASDMFRPVVPRTADSRIQRPRKPRRVKSCPYCGKQVGFEFGNYRAHMELSLRNLWTMVSRRKKSRTEMSRTES
jgi:hypothetical protein